MTPFILHSGGAAGADKAWDQLGKESGLPLNVRHWTPMDLYTATNQDQLREAVYKAADALGRPRRFKGEHYVMRNWFQAYHCHSLYAISTIIPNGGKDRGFTNTSGKDVVAGGTGWTVEMAIQMGKPVYVFDQTLEMWFWWDTARKVFILPMQEELYQGPDEQLDGIPILTPSFAGIGTRNINQAGLQAIKEVYQKTLTHHDSL